jgi:micrococcal nuclease
MQSRMDTRAMGRKPAVLRRFVGAVPLLLLVLAAPVAAPPAWATGAPTQPEPVADGVARAVVDGDTLVLESGAEVRLVGIQAPKLPLGRRNFPTWPLAGEAKQALSDLVLGRRIELWYGGREVDRHGRLLAHVSTAEAGWVQGALLRRGLARVYTFPDNRARAADMLALEDEARAARQGIWGHPWYRILDAEAAEGFTGTFQLVEGTVRGAATVRGRAYLNFGDDWRTDFTVTMSSQSLRRNWRGLSVDDYEGRRVRVRGWMRDYNGPLIEATHPEQIEVLP